MRPLRHDFPQLAAQPDLAYLDSAATALVPTVVATAVAAELSLRAPVGRGLYPASVAATQRFADHRAAIAAFFNAQPDQTVLTSGATAAFNLLATGLAHSWQPGDSIILSPADHHSLLLPFRAAAEAAGATVRYANLTAAGETDLDLLPGLLDGSVRAIALGHITNVTGSVLNLEKLAEIADRQGRRPLLIIDGCQAAPHLPLDLPTLGVDAYVAASHKLYGPSGIGVLSGSPSLFAELQPATHGGGAVASVNLAAATPLPGPERLEPGTPPAEAAAGFAAALSYPQSVGMSAVTQHTADLHRRLRETVERSGGTIVGEPQPESGILSFTVGDIHAHDAAEFLGERGVCVRAGKHCAHPVHDHFNLAGTVRASLGIYNGPDDIAALADGLAALRSAFDA